MTDSKSKFVYVTWIRTTPEKIWQAITQPEWTRQFWCECWQDCEWKPGASWKLMLPDGRLADSGEVLEIETNKRIVLSWRNEFRPELHEEGYSRMTWEIEQHGESVKLTVSHEVDKPGAKLIDAVSGGWPLILSGLKSLLETGTAIEQARQSHKKY